MQRRTAVILAADIAGYSRLVAQAEEQALLAYADHRSVFDAAIAHYGGRIFNTAGDAVRAEFTSPADTVRAAADLQRALKARNASYPLARQLHFRIGIADGEVCEQDGDLHGAAVTLALALETAAPPGGICVSSGVHSAVDGTCSEAFAAMGLVRVPTLAEPVTAYAVIIDPAAASGTLAPQPITSARYGSLRSAAIAIVAIAAIVGLSRGLPSQDPTVAVPAGTPAPHAPVQASNAPAAEPAATVKPDTPSPAPAASAPTPAPSTGPSSISASSDWAAVTARLQRLWNECDSSDPKLVIDGCGGLVAEKTLAVADQVRANMAYGKALRDQSRTDDAIAAYSTAIRLAPTSDLYNQRGIVYYDKSDWDRAIADYTEAIKLDNRNGEAFNNRAWTKFKTGRATDALDDAKTASGLLDHAGYVWDTLGHIYEATGDTGNAISSFKRALVLDPAIETSKAGLKRLTDPR